MHTSTNNSQNIPFTFKQTTMCTLCNSEATKFPEDLMLTYCGKPVCIKCCRKILPNHCRLCGMEKNYNLDVQNIIYNGNTIPICEKCVRLKNNNFACQLCNVVINKKPYTMHQNMDSSTLIVCNECFKNKCHNCTKPLFNNYERFKISIDSSKKTYCLDCYLLNLPCYCNICTKLKSKQTIDISTISDDNICPYWKKRLGKM